MVEGEQAWPPDTAHLAWPAVKLSHSLHGGVHKALQAPSCCCEKTVLPASLQVAEQATQYFITNDRPNVAGLVLAGSADFKTELGQSDMFDQRLKAVVLLTVDVSYGAFR